LEPLLTPGCGSRRPPPGRSPARSPCGVQPGGLRGAVARRWPRSTRPGGASTSCPEPKPSSCGRCSQGDAGVQHDQNALEHDTVRMPLAPGKASAALNLRQQRFDHRPQLVFDMPRLRSSHPAPPDRHFQSDPTTRKIISLGVLREAGAAPISSGGTTAVVPLSAGKPHPERQRACFGASATRVRAHPGR
jgi:hypothetical protein